MLNQNYSVLKLNSSTIIFLLYRTGLTLPNNWATSPGLCRHDVIRAKNLSIWSECHVCVCTVDVVFVQVLSIFSLVSDHTESSQAPEKKRSVYQMALSKNLRYYDINLSGGISLYLHICIIMNIIILMWLSINSIFCPFNQEQIQNLLDILQNMVMHQYTYVVLTDDGDKGMKSWIFIYLLFYITLFQIYVNSWMHIVWLNLVLGKFACFLENSLSWDLTVLGPNCSTLLF